MTLSLDKKISVRLWLSAALITAMILFAELLGEKEIIFPEIAALAVGAWLSPKLPWETNRMKILLLLSLSAGIGYVLSAYVNLPLYFKILLGMILCMVLLLLSRTTMLPLISACILPILTEADSFIYPVSVMVLTAVIVSGQALLETTKLKEVHHYQPVVCDIRTEFVRWLLIILSVSIMAGAALWLDTRFMIAPPLIVMLCELSYTDSKARNKPWQILFLTAFAAFAGAYARILFCGILHFPLFLPALLVSALILCFMTILKLYFPPAAAIAILPFIINEQALFLYPVQVTTGSIVFISLAMLFGKLLKGCSK